MTRVGIITGASSGIGKYTAYELSKMNTKLILTARNKAELENIKNEIENIQGKETVSIIAGDILDKSVMQQCIDISKSKWNTTIDFFIASAGKGLPGNLITSNEEQWKSLWDLNVISLTSQLKMVVEEMLSNKDKLEKYIENPLDIIVLGSSIGRNVSPFNSIYGATKFAVHGLTEALRRDVGPKGIRTTLIEPGIVKSSFQESAGYDMEWFNGYEKEVGPVLVPKDVAKVISFALSLPGNVNLDDISIRPTRQSYP